MTTGTIYYDMLNLFLLIVSLFIVIKSADFAIKYAVIFARSLRLPKYTVGFFIVAIISMLPEMFISIDSALRGIPSFGLGTLFGSNVADLTLVFAIVIFSTARPIKVDSKILKNNNWYPFLLALPILVGSDGYYSRAEGVLLIAAGLFFYNWTFRKNRHIAPPNEHERFRVLDLAFLIISMGILLVASNYTVKYGVAFAESMDIGPAFIGMVVVGLGTTLPELFFSLRAVKHHKDALALGDILGTVISDATILVGILALIHPFYFPQRIVFVTATFMVLASLALLTFMRSGRELTRREGVFLVLFYLVFVATELLINKQ